MRAGVGVDRRRGGLLILGAATLWGTAGTAQALGPSATTPLGVGTVRLFVGAAGLLLLAAARTGGSFPGSADTAGSSGSARTQATRAATLVGGVAVAAYQLAFFAGVQRLGVALGTVIAIGSAPVFTGLFSAGLLRRAPGRAWMVATLASTLGVGVLLAPAGGVTLDTTGLLLALLAGGSYATYAIAGKAMIEGGLGPSAVMARLFTIGALMAMPLLFTEPMEWLGSVPGLTMAAWLGVGATTLAYALFGRGLATVTAPVAATLSLAEPLTASLLGVVVLGERLGTLQLLGAVAVVLGLALTVREGTEL